MKLEYIKDIANNNYLGLKFDPQLVYPFIEEMKIHLNPTEFEEYRKYQQDRDRSGFHLTLFNVAEFNQLVSKLGMDRVTEAIQKWQAFDFHPKLMGLGTATKNGNRAFFIVVECPELQELRKTWGFEAKDFHITLGFKFKDVFGVPKNEILEKPNPFFKEIKTKWLERESWEFIRRIENYSASSTEEIIPYEITKSGLKLAIGDTRVQVGYLEGENKLWIMAQWNNPDSVIKLSTSQIIDFFKNN